MSLILLDPRGEVAKIQRKAEIKPGDLKGKRVGFVFNQHKSALGFWKTLESEIEKSLQPAAIRRVYKENTWAPAPKAEIDALAQETDYVLIGLGA